MEQPHINNTRIAQTFAIQTVTPQKTLQPHTISRMTVREDSDMLLIIDTDNPPFSGLRCTERFTGRQTLGNVWTNTEGAALEGNTERSSLASRNDNYVDEHYIGLLQLSHQDTMTEFPDPTDRDSRRRKKKKTGKTSRSKVAADARTAHK
jgi:hypothetical protein